MGKRQKRGKAGNAAQYLTRNQAIKKLQLRLSEFRRLCVLKGIHPREPKKKFKGANKTYYHVKDINWLAHEPLIHTFRSLKVHDRRVRKAAAKQQMKLARRLMSNKPGYKLDHLVKERYPSFIDAVRDLDDPLTLVHLFATLPAEATKGIKPATVDKCRRIMLEWDAYVARTSALRRVFVSVKGFYYQADIAGCSVTWLVPHQLAQVLPSDVDFAVMLTFLEFHCCLLQFVMFKLYHDLGLRYPPVVDRRLEESAAGLAGLMRDIAAAADSSRTQQQQQLEAAAAAGDGSDGGVAAAEAQPVPEVVQRLGTLGKKIKELQQQQQQGAAAAAAAGSDDAASDQEDSEGSLPDIDSGAGEDDSEDESSQGEGDEDESSPEPEDEAAAAAAAADGADDSAEAGDEERQQQNGDASAAAAGAAGVVSDGAAVAGGGLCEVDADDDAGLCSVLLKGMTFFLAREVPREPLLLMIRSFGGVAGWSGEGSPVDETDEAIDYQIVDRPTQGHKYLSRSYVQPQWLFDSINHRVLMPAELYAPGVVPPPHLSPFVDNEAEGYTPEFAHTIKQLQEAARAARKAAAGRAHEAAFLEGDGGAAAAAAAGAEDADGSSAAATATADEAAAAAEKVYKQELVKELKGAAGQQQQQQDSEDDAEGASEGEEEDANKQQPQQQQQSGKKRPAAAAAAEAEEEEAAMADIMMSRKNRKLYGRINRAIQGKAERVAVLEQRKQVLEQQSQEKGGKKSAAGGAEQQQQQQRRSKQRKKGGK